MESTRQLYGYSYYELVCLRVNECFVNRAIFHGGRCRRHSCHQSDVKTMAVHQR